MTPDQLLSRNALRTGWVKEALQTDGTVEEKVYKKKFFKYT